MVVAVVAIALARAFWPSHRMPRDIFPDLGVPALYVAQPYGGMDPAQMEGFIVNYYEYHFLYINGIEHVESKSIQGAALIKLQFHPGTNMAQAMAETVSYVNRARAFMPAGTVPPFVMRFDAGSVPVGNLVFSEQDAESRANLQDAALFRVRPLFATLPGVSAPPPFGGSQRTIVIHADPDKLRAYNMSPDEVVRRSSAGNIISPSGQRALRRHDPDGSGQFGGDGHQGAGRCSDPLAGNAHHLSARYRIGRGRRGHRNRLRARQWPPHRLHPGHETRRRLHAGGRQPGQRESAEFPGRAAGRHRSATSSTSRLT